MLLQGSHRGFTESRKAGSTQVFGQCRKCGSSLVLWVVYRESRVKSASLTKWLELASFLPFNTAPASKHQSKLSTTDWEKLCWLPGKPGMFPHPYERCWGTVGKLLLVRLQGLGGTYSSVTSFGMPLGRARRPLLLHRTTVSTQVHCSGQRGLSWQLLSSLPVEDPGRVSIPEDKPYQESGQGKLDDRARLFPAKGQLSLAPAGSQSQD